MLDKFDEKKKVSEVFETVVEKEIPVKTVAEETKQASEVFETVVEKEIPVSAAETKEASVEVATEETKEAPVEAVVKVEQKKTGYRSEIDGVEVDFELQYREHETDMKDIAKRVTEDYTKRGNDASAIKLIQVYLKPTDFTAYYVINNSYEGKIPLF